MKNEHLENNQTQNFIDAHRQNQDIETDVFELPSKGYFYDEDNPLSEGVLEIRYMTAKDEDIITDQKLIKSGKMIDKLLERLIVTPINIDDMLLGDKAAAIVASRIVGYGRKYRFEYKDPASGRKKTMQVDLVEDVKEKAIPFEEFEKGQDVFEYKLPVSERNVKFRLLTDGDNKEISAVQERMGSSSSTITLRLTRMIQEVDGVTKRNDIKYFVENMLKAQDSKALRDEVKRISPDVDLSVNVEDDDGTIQEIPIQITSDFFFPSQPTT